MVNNEDQAKSDLGANNDKSQKERKDEPMKITTKDGNGLATVNRTEKIRRWYSSGRRNGGGTHDSKANSKDVLGGVQKATG